MGYIRRGGGKRKTVKSGDRDERERERERE